MAGGEFVSGRRVALGQPLPRPDLAPVGPTAFGEMKRDQKSKSESSGLHGRVGGQLCFKRQGSKPLKGETPC